MENALILNSKDMLEIIGSEIKDEVDKYTYILGRAPIVISNKINGIIKIKKVNLVKLYVSVDDVRKYCRLYEIEDDDCMMLYTIFVSIVQQACTNNYVTLHLFKNSSSTFIRLC